MADGLDSAAIGAIIGAAARAGPEILKFIDRHLDRRHELAMQDKALEFEKQSPGRMSAKSSIDAGQLQDVLGIMREAYSQQFNSGNPWLNAVSVLVRPTTTAILVWLYVGVKVVMLCAAMTSPAPIDSLLRAYNDNDFAVLSGILTFWFLDRGLFKAAGK